MQKLWYFKQFQQLGVFSYNLNTRILESLKLPKITPVQADNKQVAKSVDPTSTTMFTITIQYITLLQNHVRIHVNKSYEFPKAYTG